MFKDGDREELDNYRGIALSCVVRKVFKRVLDEWIRAVSEEMVMKEAHAGRVQESKRMCRSDLHTES